MYGNTPKARLKVFSVVFDYQQGCSAICKNKKRHPATRIAGMDVFRLLFSVMLLLRNLYTPFYYCNTSAGGLSLHLRFREGKLIFCGLRSQRTKLNDNLSSIVTISSLFSCKAESEREGDAAVTGIVVWN